MREVAVDTETTGLDPASGHRIVEIGCVELLNHLPTGRTFQRYVNPERDVPPEVVDVHGLTAEFLATHPVFADIADDFLAFLGEARLVIHNAQFDMGFINAELTRLGRPSLDMDRALDTVHMARRKFPGAQANLDALCRRFQIDNSDRSLHGALKDARLLASVYLELVGGRQPGLQLAGQGGRAGAEQAGPVSRRPPRPHKPEPEEEAAHTRFVDSLEAPVWRS
jgi:DNA polymerase-3 subunit epsilon